MLKIEDAHDLISSLNKCGWRELSMQIFGEGCWEGIGVIDTHIKEFIEFDYKWEINKRSKV